MQHQDCAMFVQTLLHSATIAHQLHLQSKSYSEHQALGAYYEEIPDLENAILSGNVSNFFINSLNSDNNLFVSLHSSSNSAAILS